MVNAAATHNRSSLCLRHIGVSTLRGINRIGLCFAIAFALLLLLLFLFLLLASRLALLDNLCEILDRNDGVCLDGPVANGQTEQFELDRVRALRRGTIKDLLPVVTAATN